MNPGRDATTETLSAVFVKIADMKPRLIIACLAAGTLATSAQECQLKTSGLYISKVLDENGNRKYLRFTGDGTLLKIFSDERADYVAGWLTGEREGIVPVKYKMEKCAIEFTVKKKSGKFHYRGQIEGDSIILQQYANKNSKPVELIYRFAPVKQ